MRHASRLTRALSLLLALTALLPATLRARAPACGSDAAALAAACCCEPKAPACDPQPTLSAGECGCCLEPQPAAPAERDVAPSPELGSLATPPCAAPAPTRATAAAAVHARTPLGHRPAGCELLRLHCVNLI